MAYYVHSLKGRPKYNILGLLFNSKEGPKNVDTEQTIKKISLQYVYNT
jgi:hypothetical protein